KHDSDLLDLAAGRVRNCEGVIDLSLPGYRALGNDLEDARDGTLPKRRAAPGQRVTRPKITRSNCLGPGAIFVCDLMGEPRCKRRPRRTVSGGAGAELCHRAP